MKILVIHSKDDPLRSATNHRRWDRVIDLGFAGPNAYERWTELLRCPIEPAGRLDDADFGEIRDALSSGLGVLVDKQGLDWWDLIAFEFHQQLEQVVQLKKFAATCGPGDEIFITRSGFYAVVLELLLDRPVRSLSCGNSTLRKLRHYAQVMSKFSAQQLLQILGDKYDTGYQIRRLVASRAKTSSRPVVLLPSAYINVTRAELQYAAMLPDSDFLLVTTRQSGRMAEAPKNVAAAKLASYACGDSNRTEFTNLLERWNQLQRELMRDQVLSVLIGSGALNSFPRFLRDGLMIRDAWLQVFQQQPVWAVLCADDANLPTRIPLLIAAQREVPAISCHHGALDGRHRFRSKQDWLFLAKGRMEQDYLTRVCQVAAENVAIGAPGVQQGVRANTPIQKRSIVFFSEPYEILGGRPAEFYNEILPPLADLALASNRALVIKLHPAESLRERKALAKSILSQQQFKAICFVVGPLTEKLLDSTWFAVTVLSTTAVECATRGIPAFLCAWLEYSNYAYSEQFAKFGAGVRLRSLDEIESIPARLKDFLPARSSDLYQPIEPERLDDLLSVTPAEMAAAV